MIYRCNGDSFYDNGYKIEWSSIADVVIKKQKYKNKQAYIDHLEEMRAKWDEIAYPSLNKNKNKNGVDDEHKE